jgi:hypothetical protein
MSLPVSIILLGHPRAKAMHIVFIKRDSGKKDVYFRFPMDTNHTGNERPGSTLYIARMVGFLDREDPFGHIGCPWITLSRCPQREGTSFQKSFLGVNAMIRSMG